MTRWCFYLLIILISILGQVRSNNKRTYAGSVVQYKPSAASDQSSTAIIQFNLNNYAKIIEYGKTKSADIILFPEHGLTQKLEIPQLSENPIESFVSFETGSTQHDRYERDIATYASNYRTFYKNDAFINLSIYMGQVLCQSGSNNQKAPFISQLSCHALNNRVYIVVNHFERVDCDRQSNKKCPIDGFFFYSVNVVFDRRGALIARYRKHAQFDEPWIDVPDEPETVYFTTDFNVTFGLLIGFDIMERKIMDLYANNHDITDMLMSTSKFPIPFITSAMDQVHWSGKNNVHLLVAGFGWDADSGIYLGNNGPVGKYIPYNNPNNVYLCNISVSSRKSIHSLLSTDMPTASYLVKPKKIISNAIKKRSPSLPQPIISYNLDALNLPILNNDRLILDLLPNDWTLEKFALPNYLIVKPVDAKQNFIFERLCVDKDFCCVFTGSVEKEKLSEQKLFHRYSMVIFRAAFKVTNGSIAIIEVCSVMSCINESPQSCGKHTVIDEPATRLHSQVRFNSLDILRYVNGNYNDIIGAPLASLTYNLLNLPEYKYEKIKYTNTSSFRTSLVRPHRDLMVFGINLRRFYTPQQFNDLQLQKQWFNNSVQLPETIHVDNSGLSDFFFGLLIGVAIVLSIIGIAACGFKIKSLLQKLGFLTNTHLLMDESRMTPEPIPLRNLPLQIPSQDNEEVAGALAPIPESESVTDRQNKNLRSSITSSKAPSISSVSQTVGTPSEAKALYQKAWDSVEILPSTSKSRPPAVLPRSDSLDPSFMPKPMSAERPGSGRFYKKEEYELQPHTGTIRKGSRPPLPPKTKSDSPTPSKSDSPAPPIPQKSPATPLPIADMFSTQPTSSSEFSAPPIPPKSPATPLSIADMFLTESSAPPIPPKSPATPVPIADMFLTEFSAPPIPPKSPATPVPIADIFSTQPTSSTESSAHSRPPKSPQLIADMFLTPHTSSTESSAPPRPPKSPQLKADMFLTPHTSLTESSAPPRPPKSPTAKGDSSPKQDKGLTEPSTSKSDKSPKSNLKEIESSPSKRNLAASIKARLKTSNLPKLILPIPETVDTSPSQDQSLDTPQESSSTQKTPSKIPKLGKKSPQSGTKLTDRHTSLSPPTTPRKSPQSSFMQNLSARLKPRSPSLPSPTGSSSSQKSSSLSQEVKSSPKSPKSPTSTSSSSSYKKSLANLSCFSGESGASRVKEEESDLCEFVPLSLLPKKEQMKKFGKIYEPGESLRKKNPSGRTRAQAEQELEEMRKRMERTRKALKSKEQKPYVKWESKVKYNDSPPKAKSMDGTDEDQVESSEVEDPESLPKGDPNRAKLIKQRSKSLEGRLDDEVAPATGATYDEVTLDEASSSTASDSNASGFATPLPDDSSYSRLTYDTYSTEMLRPLSYEVNPRRISEASREPRARTGLPRPRATQGGRAAGQSEAAAQAAGSRYATVKLNTDSSGKAQEDKSKSEDPTPSATEGDRPAEESEEDDKLVEESEL